MRQAPSCACRDWLAACNGRRGGSEMVQTLFKYPDLLLIVVGLWGLGIIVFLARISHHLAEIAVQLGRRASSGQSPVA